MSCAPVAWIFPPHAVRATPGLHLTLKSSRATLEKNWLANFENMELVKRFRHSGKGRIDGARKGDYGCRSIFDYRGDGGDSDVAGHVGRIRGGGHEREINEYHQNTIY